MNLKKELPLITIVLLPFIYLAYIWNQLPEKVPLRWDFNGEITKYGDKIELLLVVFMMPLFSYIMFLVIPKIDPKNKLNTMGNKLQSIKFMTTAVMSILAIFIIYAAKNGSLANPNYIVLLVGCLYIILGNYFKTIKPNYFMGIKTPWTLESEMVWKETHILGGKMWFIGGLLVVVASLILNTKLNLIIFSIITGIITIVPIVYSYLLFRKEKSQNL